MPILVFLVIGHDKVVFSNQSILFKHYSFLFKNIFKKYILFVLYKNIIIIIIIYVNNLF